MPRSDSAGPVARDGSGLPRADRPDPKRPDSLAVARAAGRRADQAREPEAPRPSKRRHGIGCAPACCRGSTSHGRRRGRCSTGSCARTSTAFSRRRPPPATAQACRASSSASSATSSAAGSYGEERRRAVDVLRRRPSSRAAAAAPSLLDMAQARWCRLDGAPLLPLVRAGIGFVDGVQQASKRARVTWPSGVRTTLPVLAANRRYTLTDGEGEPVITAAPAPVAPTRSSRR